MQISLASDLTQLGDLGIKKGVSCAHPEPGLGIKQMDCTDIKQVSDPSPYWTIWHEISAKQATRSSTSFCSLVMELTSSK